MPESVSGVAAILDGLREAMRWTWPTVLHGPPSRDPSTDGRVEMVPLADAVAAVHAAADARTQEMLTALSDPAVSLAGVPMTTRRRLADSLARRFPNGGTDARD